MTATPMRERIIRGSELDVRTGCWEWLKMRDRDGYGLIGIHHSPRFAHRIAYQEFVGPIPDGLQIDHLCRNRRCVNPTHLQPVTSRENTMRSPIAPAAVNAAKMQCAHGHPLSGDNVYATASGRSCRRCRAEATRRWRRRQVAMSGFGG